MRSTAILELIRRGVQRGERAWADFGAGDGAFTRALRELLGPAADVYAVDVDASGLRHKLRSPSSLGDEGNTHLIEADFTLGHEVVAPDLPCDDDAAGFPEYVDTVVDAIGARNDLVVVGQSYGGFTAPLVAERLGIKPHEIAAGHCAALSRPKELADMLTGFAPS